MTPGDRRSTPPNSRSSRNAWIASPSRTGWASRAESVRGPTVRPPNSVDPSRLRAALARTASMHGPRPHLLPRHPDVADATLRQVRDDFERFGRGGLPHDLESYLRETYRLDVAASYAGF